MDCPKCGEQVAAGEFLCECGYALGPAVPARGGGAQQSFETGGPLRPSPQIPDQVVGPNEGATSADMGVVRQGKLVVKGIFDVLPDRCIKCNGLGDGKNFDKTMVWITPWAYIGLIFGVLPLLIFYLIFRKTARVNFWICKAHARKRSKAILITLLLVFSGIALIIGGAAISSEILIWAGVLAIIASIIYGPIATRLIAPRKITDEYVWLSGAGKEYLDSLPAAQSS